MCHTAHGPLCGRERSHVSNQSYEAGHARVLSSTVEHGAARRAVVPEANREKCPGEPAEIGRAAAAFVTSVAFHIERN